jgi:hypothetical protein
MGERIKVMTPALSRRKARESCRVQKNLSRRLPAAALPVRLCNCVVEYDFLVATQSIRYDFSRPELGFVQLAGAANG